MSHKQPCGKITPVQIPESELVCTAIQGRTGKVLNRHPPCKQNVAIALRVVGVQLELGPLPGASIHAERLGEWSGSIRCPHNRNMRAMEEGGVGEGLWLPAGFGIFAALVRLVEGRGGSDNAQVMQVLGNEACPFSPARKQCAFRRY